MARVARPKMTCFLFPWCWRNECIWFFLYDVGNKKMNIIGLRIDLIFNNIINDFARFPYRKDAQQTHRAANYETKTTPQHRSYSPLSRCL